MTLAAAIRDGERAWPPLVGEEHEHLAAHRERVAADVRRVERARAPPDVEVLDGELLRTLDRMRCRRRVEAEEVVRIAPTGDAALELPGRLSERSAPREPRLARVRVEAGLEEGLAGARLVRHGAEDAMHAVLRGERGH